MPMIDVYAAEASHSHKDALAPRLNPAPAPAELTLSVAHERG
jgi:hypothetical protein